MPDNGDERMQAAWERVEAKLDRLGEVQAEHGRVLTLLDRRLNRVEGNLDMVKLMLEGVRQQIERRAERLKDELLTELGRETRVELRAAQGLNEDRLSALERRGLALEGGEG
ncbi:MAG: hypothetical protein U1E52_10000 [Geminicoccaceae bacterium]